MSDDGKPLFDMKYCTRCCMPETEEGYQDDGMGICRVCRSSEQKMHIDWAERWKALEVLMEEAKQNSGTNYDCIVPISGGKDSMFQLHVLVNVLGIKPLTVTYNHNWLSETGYYNLMNCLEAFDVDHIQFTPNRNLLGRLAKRSLPMIGDACWQCHSGVGAFPIHIAMKFNIPLIIYGESVAEVTQRGDYFTTVKPCYSKDYFTEFSAKKTPDEMVCEYITPKDVHMYQLPTDKDFDDAKIKIMHLGDYIFWDDERQTEFLRDTYGWRETEVENAYKGYKSAECIMPGVHDFTCYLKRGWGRSSFHSSVDVRNGLLTREEGFDLIRKHDTQRPEALDYYLQITGYSEEEFYEIMEGHRLPQLKDSDVPVTEREAPNKEKLLPFPLQILDKLGPKRPPVYEDDGLSGAYSEIAEDSASDTPLWDLSIAQVMEGYREGTFKPTEVAQSYIDRIEKVDGDVHAWVGFDPEKMMSGARLNDVALATGARLRLLEGVPFGVKDTFNTIDFPTEMGSPQWKGFTPGNDSRVVFNLKRSGAVISGKTVTAEFAVHELNETLNPHDPELTPGTSSSGSAAAVAAGMVPASVGTQTAASVIRPASFCGIYGMKPSYGTVPRTGVLKTTDTLDSIGFFVRHLEDLERVYNAIRVHGEDYPFVNRILENPDKQKIDPEGPWRVGFVKTHTWDEAESYAQQALSDWVEELSSHMNDVVVKEVELPAAMKRSHDIHATIYNKTLSYYFQSEFESRGQMSDTMASLIEKGQEIDPADYRSSLDAQKRLIDEMDQFMQGYDILVCLSTAGSAPLRNVVEKDDPGLMWTLTHLPAINLPVFADQRGMPFGAQVVARKYRDIGLIRFVQELRAAGMVPASANKVERLGDL